MIRIEDVLTLCEEYEKGIRADLADRCQRWVKDPSLEAIYAAIGGLLSRQVTLASEFTKSPNAWNMHTAHLFLRPMTDVHINLAWILEDPKKRSEDYILYGLGQAKLGSEHRKARIKARGGDPEQDPIAKFTEDWINSQRFAFLVGVNLGAWSERSTRKMAEEADLLSFYDYTFAPFSASVHSTWWHVGLYNTVRSDNPLHRHIAIPALPELDLSLEFLRLAVKYEARTMELFDNAFFPGNSLPSRYEWFGKHMEKISSVQKAPGGEVKK